jgi:pseudaminic acid biosynthesis-associated methylase
MSNFATDQEAFWAGEFGDAYSKRNIGDHWVAANTALFASILNRTRKVESLIEFGANIGLNLRSLHHLRPTLRLAGIEINPTAASELRDWGKAEVIEASILDSNFKQSWDFALIKGVLIHINPAELLKVYDSLFSASSRYICIVEYYNPTPVTLDYRGHSDRLFKRDFAGEMLDRFSSLTLVDYGFCYHRDPNFPQDDVTWFLMEKA